MKRWLREELDEEFAAHVELGAYHLVRRGWSPDEAEREARRRFGDPRRIRRHVLRVRRPGWLRLGHWLVRASVAGAGVGLLTAAATVAYGFEQRRPNTFVEPGPWVSVWGTDGVGESPLTTYAEYRTLAARTDVLTRLTAARYETRRIDWDSSPARTGRIKRVSINYVSAIGARPILGRGFLPGEDGEAVAVLSAAAWEEWFDRSDRVVGRTVSIGGTPHRIVGVLPPDVRFYYESHLLVPLSAMEEAGRAGPRLLVSGMLRHELTPESATAALDWGPRPLRVVTAQRSYSEGFRDPAAKWLWVAALVALACLLGTARIRTAFLVRGVRDPEVEEGRSARLAGWLVGSALGAACAAELGRAIAGDTAVVFDFSPGLEITGWALLVGSAAWVVAEGVLAVARSTARTVAAHR